MNLTRKAFELIVRVALFRVTYRQMSAVLVLMAVMVPITVPVPIWAYSLDLPPAPIENKVFNPAVPDPLAESSPLDFVERLFSASDDRKKERSAEKTFDEAVGGDSAASDPAETEAANEGPKSKASKTTPVQSPPKKSAVAAAPQAVDLPIGEIDSLFTPQNNLGTPIGQTEPSAKVEAAAMSSIRERAGVGNFSFNIPVASLPSRGMDASVGITYNSRLWTKSGTNNFTYDVENSWLAPGFNLSLGYLELEYPSGQSPIPRILTDPNGTRHQLFSVGSGNYETADGTFIRVQGYTATFPDGTKIRYYTDYATGVLQRHYPTSITDRHGNMMFTVYDSDLSGRLKSIVDTIGRYIRFHYDTTPEKKLVAVTVPSYLAGPNSDTSDPTLDRQTIRFYYETLNLQYQGRFDGTMNVPNNGTLNVLKYVYFPGTKTGFRYDYSPSYGMIYRITKLAGMTVDSNSLQQTGSVTSAGTHIEVATTKYNYPGTDTEPPAPTLSDMPKYNRRIDDWLGRTGGGVSPVTYYNVVEDSGNSTRTTTITTPDGATTETVANFKPGQWDDGLIKQTAIKNSSGGVMSKSVMTWEQGGGTVGQRNPRVKQVDITNEANQTKSTVFEYADLAGNPCQYNNVCQTKEYDFASGGGALLRNTVTTYVTSSSYINNRLLHLVDSVKVISGGQTVSRTEYKYDEYPLTTYSNNSIVNFDKAYNPATGAPYQFCEPGCEGRTRGDCCWTVPGFNYSTTYRGNVTQVKRWADPANDSDPLADTTVIKYDIAGNALESTANCCQLKKWVYDATNQYAYPVQEKKGQNQELVTSAVYDFNTGLMKSSTDENNQPTSYEYEPDTLRAKKVIYPNGGYVLSEYSDKLITNPSDLVPGFVRTTATLDTNKTVQSYGYFDGSGAAIRSATQTPDGWSITAVENDNAGRPKKSYNPFYAATPTATVPTGAKFTEVMNFDALGRATQIKMQDSTVVNSYPNEAAVTVTYPDSTQVTGTASRAKDQADKERRQVVDALGRLIRVDEPTANGIGTAAAPNQPTFYNYDGNDNLVKVIQSDGTNTQERKFRYDGLSRLTHEKQVEANATLDDTGLPGPIAPNKWTRVLKYDSLARLHDAIDANGVTTTFAEYDTLNRIKRITYSDGTPQVTYTYDQARSGQFNNGKLTRVETAAGDAVLRPNTPATASEFDYDQMGRMVKHRQWIGADQYDLEYGYNLAGQLTTQKYPSGKIITTSYDANGRLSGVTDTQRTYLSGMQYLGKGNSLSQMTFGNGTVENYVLNDRLQMTSQSLLKGSEVLQKYDYTFGQINDQTGVLDATKNNGQLAMIESYIGANKQATQKFKYDQIGRLKESAEYRGDNGNLTYKQVFDFDRFGNLYRKAASNPIAGQQNPLSFTPVEENVDIEKTTNRFKTTTGTTYDDAGNVIVDNKFRQMSFAYDANGRQIKASRASVPDAWTVYDAVGNRVATKINNIWQYMVYDAIGKLVAEYGQASDGLGGVKYVQQDWQGSVRTVTNANGFVVSRTDHQAFGGDVGYGVGQRSIEQGYNADPATRQGYGLTERDDATGLDHTWFRKNENAAGRWTSPDPYNGSMNLGDPQSFNRYSYVGNEPTNYVDPSGLLYAFCDASMDYATCNALNAYLNGGSIGGTLTIIGVYHWNGDGYDLVGGNVYFDPSFGGHNPRDRELGHGSGAGGGDCPPGPFGVADPKCLLKEAGRNAPKSQQAEFDDCVRTAIRTWRRAEYYAVGKISGGTVIGTLATIAGFNASIRIGSILTSGVRITRVNLGGRAVQGVMYGSALIGYFTGDAVVSGFKDSANNAAVRDAAIADCKSKFPNSNQSNRHLAAISIQTW